MQSKIRALQADAERSATAVEQMDEYRRMLRQKETETRDLQLKLYRQEATLQEFKYAESRYAAMEKDIAMYKNKVEKIPALVSEVARLRGSSRATSKALDDQDKQLHDFKRTAGSLDRENSRLKADLRRHVDSEQKYHDAQEQMGQIKAFMTSSPTRAGGAVSSSSGGAGVEEKDPSMIAPDGSISGAPFSTTPVDGTSAIKLAKSPQDYKKIRRMMRASLVASNGGSKAGLSKSIEDAIATTLNTPAQKR